MVLPTVKAQETLRFQAQIWYNDRRAHYTISAGGAIAVRGYGIIRALGENERQ